MLIAHRKELLAVTTMLQAKQEDEEQSFEVFVRPGLEPSAIASSILHLLKK